VTDPGALRFAVVDVETTGLAAGIDRIVECAVVEYDPAGVECDAWSTLLSTPGEGELGASHIHGITRAMTLGAPTFGSVGGELGDRLRGRVLVGHVIGFDLGYLRAEFARAGVALPPVAAAGICTHDAVKRHLPPGSRTLRACCERLCLPFDDAHSALGDARATAALLLALRGRFGDLGAGRAWRAASRTEWPEILGGTAAPWTRERSLSDAPLCQ
jgi:DNA polymerase III subunit epsilon